LIHYITHADPKKFQPANITFDLLPPLERKVRDRQLRHKMQCEFALGELESWVRRPVPAPDDIAVQRVS
jgi:methylenetetrahydrofolate--tRNA-(uracil-5-)-methyltransferase